MRKLLVLAMTGIMVLGSGVCVQAADKQEINIAWCDDTLDATRSKMIEDPGISGNQFCMLRK